MNNEYYTNNKYYLERHRNALELGFTYLGDDRYKLPKSWGGENIVVDLSATGREQDQILKSVSIQLVQMIKIHL